MGRARKRESPLVRPNLRAVLDRNTPGRSAALHARDHKVVELPFNYVDYEVARLFEDLQEHLPASLEAVPLDISARATDRAWLRQISSWVDDEACTETEGRRRWELYEAGMSWWWDREIETGYLTHGPRISVWRTNDDVHFRWTTLENEHSGLPVFVEPRRTNHDQRCVRRQSPPGSGDARGVCDTFRSPSDRW